MAVLWGKTSMTFDEAVNCHSEWKRKLQTYLSNPDGSIDVEEVGSNNKCKLGKWIRGDGRKYAGFPEFARLIAEHTRFHRAAVDLMSRANRGQDVSFEFALGVGNEFSLASSAVVLAIMDMKKRYEVQSRQQQEREHAVSWLK
ncbi:MAG: CZB domain-containing protein [Terriglobales bacterium]